MSGKKITFALPDGSNADYTIGLLTFDQEQEVLGADPPLPPKEQQLKLVKYGASIDDVGSLPALHFKKLVEAILELNEYRTKGGDGTPAGEGQTTTLSAPSIITETGWRWDEVGSMPGLNIRKLVKGIAELRKPGNGSRIENTAHTEPNVYEMEELRLNRPVTPDNTPLGIQGWIAEMKTKK